VTVRLLYIEDNDDNIYMLSRRLARRGFDVVVATDGVAGISSAQEARPEIILMDMSLPVLDGWEATRRLKADVATRDIPVIGLSSHAMVGDREKAIAAGCDDYDTKPVDIERLVGKINGVLARGAR
jgi:CheY-like chemotaxis protein